MEMICVENILSFVKVVQIGICSVQNMVSFVDISTFKLNSFFVSLL
jgi:hypothetical protein